MENLEELLKKVMDGLEIALDRELVYQEQIKKLDEENLFLHNTILKINGKKLIEDQRKILQEKDAALIREKKAKEETLSVQNSYKDDIKKAKEIIEDIQEKERNINAYIAQESEKLINQEKIKLNEKQIEMTRKYNELVSENNRLLDISKKKYKKYLITSVVINVILIVLSILQLIT